MNFRYLFSTPLKIKMFLFNWLKNLGLKIFLSGSFLNSNKINFGFKFALKSLGFNYKKKKVFILISFDSKNFCV